MSKIKIWYWLGWILSICLIISAVVYFSNQYTPEIKQEKHAANSIKISGSDLYKKTKDSVYTVYIYSNNSRDPIGQGTAIAIDHNLLVTNCHVVNSGEKFSIIINKQEIEGYLYSERGDLCLVFIKDIKLNPVKIKLSSEVKIGEDVFAIGNPHGLEGSISKGILSKDNVIIGGVRYLQSDALISSGSSGGGLFDTAGQLIGVTTGTHSSEKGITLIIPSEAIIASVLDPIIPKEKPKKKISNGSKSKFDSTSSYVSTPRLIRLGTYGKDEVSLYSFGNFCFMTFNGYDELNFKINLAIWSPLLSNSVFIFPNFTSVKNALIHLERLVTGKGELIRTKDFIIIDDTGHPLYTDKTIRGYNNVQVASFKISPIDFFIEGTHFLVEFIDPRSEKGFVLNYYGLYGFTESLARYHSYCQAKNN